MPKRKRLAKNEIERLLQQPVQSSHLSSIQDLAEICCLDRSRYQALTGLIAQIFCADTACLVLSHLDPPLPFITLRDPVNKYLRIRKLTCALVRQVRGIEPTCDVTLRAYLKEGIPLWTSVFSNLRQRNAHLRVAKPVDLVLSNTHLSIGFDERLPKPSHCHGSIHWEIEEQRVVLEDVITPTSFRQVFCQFRNGKWQLSLVDSSQIWEGNSLGEALKLYILSR